MSEDTTKQQKHEVKRQLEVVALLATTGLALLAALKSFAILPEKLDGLTDRMGKNEARVELLMTQQNATSSAIRESLARIQESQEQFRRDITEIKVDIRELKK